MDSTKLLKTNDVVISCNFVVAYIGIKNCIKYFCSFESRQSQFLFSFRWWRWNINTKEEEKTREEERTG